MGSIEAVRCRAEREDREEEYLARLLWLLLLSIKGSVGSCSLVSQVRRPKLSRSRPDICTALESAELVK